MLSGVLSCSVIKGDQVYFLQQRILSDPRKALCLCDTPAHASCVTSNVTSYIAYIITFLEYYKPFLISSV